MATSKTPTYQQAVEQGRKLIADARLADPNEHFPYKLDAVTALLDEDPPMGPGTPEGADGAADRSREVADYMSRGIAEASADYIEAQAAWLTDPSNETRAAYETARDRLLAARLDHRHGRGAGFTIGAAARRAG